MTDSCTFCRIVAGEAAASVVLRDDAVVAFMDLHPINPGHALVVPVSHTEGLHDLEPATGQRMFAVAQRLTNALRVGSSHYEAFNLHLADGDIAGQDVFHTHLHVIPRRAGDGLRFEADAPALRRGELDRAADAIRSVL